MNFSQQHYTPGATSAEILTSLVADTSDIAAVFVFPYRHPPLLQQRIVPDEGETAIIGRAMALRKASSLPFWEALLLCCFGQDKGYRRILPQAVFHRSHNSAFIRVDRQEVLGGELVRLASSGTEIESYSVSSCVEDTQSEMKHIPLLDFHCPESSENDDIVRQACQILFPTNAFVFSSGESYHAVGDSMVSADDLRRFLIRSLLLAPIVDARYIAHQLLEGSCALRLNSSKDKPNTPRLKFVTQE